MSTDNANPLLTKPIRLVLDTNRVLDWLLFQDADLLTLTERIALQQIIVLRQAFTVQELARVLTYPQFALGSSRCDDLMHHYLAQTTEAAVPEPFTAPTFATPASFPRCKDTDDQPFLALAYHAEATLLTRDKALLKLKRKARRFGVDINITL